MRQRFGHPSIFDQLSLMHLVISRPYSQDGRTPLFSAAGEGHEGVVKLLLEAKAAVDAADKVRDDAQQTFEAAMGLDVA